MSELLWKQAFAYAVCNCAPDDDGEVRYHSNCARKLKPILEQLQTAQPPAAEIAALRECEKALRQFADNDLSDENCASVELAGRRVRNIARQALASLNQAPRSR